MVSLNNRSVVTFGGWYQRTTLHLTEVHQFLLNGSSRLDLNKSKLKHLRNALDINTVERVSGYLEYLKIITKFGIEVRYYEDGLYIVEVSEEKPEIAQEKAKNYFIKKLEPALNYLFSLGAPTPKILSNIKEEHPVVVGKIFQHPKEFKINKKRFGDVYLESSSSDTAVFKTPGYIFIVVSERGGKSLRPLIEMQIFFREFKSQLHKYLNIHRIVWEEIASIKEGGFVKGRDVSKYKAKLNSYQKTIQLIKNRINQMGSYAKTRSSVSKKLDIEDDLAILFQYRFEDLFNTLDYIKEIWAMTSDYVDSAIRIMDDVEKKISDKGIKSIQFLVGFGIVSGIVKYLGPTGFPAVAATGVLYVVGIGLIAIVIDRTLQWSSKRKKYKLKFIERVDRFGDENDK